MKILHLYSDWKWTGPAEPVMNISSGLEKLGYESIFAIRAPVVSGSNDIAVKAKQRNINFTTDLKMNRYFNLQGIKDNIFDLVNISRFVDFNKIDIVHMHLSHDFVLGVFSLGFNKKVKLIRTNHKGTILKNNFINRFLLNNIDKWIDIGECFSKKYKEKFPVYANKMIVIKGAVDYNFFSPRIKKKILLKKMNILENDYVFGIVARIQKRRNFMYLLDAINILRNKMKNFKFIFIGRGGRHLEELKNKVCQLNIEKYIVFAGYQKEKYIDYLNLLDVKLFLVPGFDGTCRAAMEAMSLEKPLIVSERGVLPELVCHGKTGFVIKEDASLLADTMFCAYKEKDKMIEMGKNARKKILEEHTIEKQVEQLDQIYQSC